jgi:hypothetical protein
MSTFKRYLLSSATTFLTSFAAVLLLNIDAINMQTLSSAATTGILFVAARAGIKALLESYVGVNADLPPMPPTAS